MPCPPYDGQVPAVTRTPATRGAGTGTVPAPPDEDDPALREELVQAVQTDERATHGDHGSSVSADDQSGEEGGAADHHQRHWLAIAGAAGRGRGDLELVRRRLADPDA